MTYAEKEQLAKAVPGAIEKLLYRIKMKVDKQQAILDKSTHSTEKIYYLEGISNEESADGNLPKTPFINPIIR